MEQLINYFGRDKAKNIAHNMTVHLFSVSIFFVWPLVVGLALVRALALVLAEVLQAQVELAEH